MWKRDLYYNFLSLAAILSASSDVATTAYHIVAKLYGSRNTAIDFNCKRVHRVSYRIFWWGGGGEEVCGRARTHNTYVLACVQARGVWGHAPPQKIFF